MTWLKYTGVVPSALPIERQIGPDVPVSIRTGYSHLDPPFYWRLVDPNSNLVEIGVNRHDGRFVSLTVVFSKEIFSLPSAAEDAPLGGDVDGLPVFSLDLWSAVLGRERDLYDRRAEFHDVRGRCRVEMGHDALRVVLSAGEIHHRVNTEGVLISEFNSANDLRAVLIPKLGPHDKSMLEESFMRLGARIQI